MFGKWFSNLAFLLQILLVVGGVLVFGFFDPFGIFKPKLTLEDTPVSVRSIKEIGQLITAEYYGEVLSSLHESHINEIEDYSNEFAKEVNLLHKEFKDAIDIIVENNSNVKKNKVRKYFHDENEELVKNIHYDFYINYLLEKHKFRNENKLLKELVFNNQKLNLGDSIDSSFLIKRKEKKLEDLFANKKLMKRQIVLVGRGWVKAGYDFGKFTQRNFKYDKDKKTIYFLGMEPKILSLTINPWFIPEKKIKGFEILLATNKAKDPKFIEQVKRACLDKLEYQAMERDILGQAKKNAEENLKNFFSLLLDEELKNVVFISNPLIYYQKSILKDNIIAGEELSAIDSLLINLYPKDISKAVEFLDFLRNSLKPNNSDGTLKTSKVAMVKFLEDSAFIDFAWDYHRYTSLIYKISNDQTLDRYEQSLLQKEKKQAKDSVITRLDSIWFNRSNEYNEIIKGISRRDFDSKKDFEDKIASVADSLRSEMATEKISNFNMTIDVLDTLKGGLINQIIVNDTLDTIRNNIRDKLKSYKIYSVQNQPKATAN